MGWAVDRKLDERHDDRDAHDGDAREAAALLERTRERLQPERCERQEGRHQ